MSAELVRALGVLAETPRPETARVARALELGTPPDGTAHTELFVFALYPYASVYVGAEGMMGGAARDRVAGFWRAIGTDPPGDPDHLAVLLGLYAELVERESRETADARRAAMRHAAGALLWEHLLSWLPPFLARVSEMEMPFYARWADLLERALHVEADRVGPPARLPLHLRAAPAMPVEGSDLDEILTSLLTPVRSGILLTRKDLARAAGELGLGLRAGERRYMLRALVTQHPANTFDWLRRETARQADALARCPPFPPVTAFWLQQARKTSTFLNRLLEARIPTHA